MPVITLNAMMSSHAFLKKWLRDLSHLYAPPPRIVNSNVMGVLMCGLLTENLLNKESMDGTCVFVTYFFSVAFDVMAYVDGIFCPISQ